MPQLYGLSETEFYIMDMIWKSNKPLLFNEIIEYFNVHGDRNWKKQTVHTHLSRLIKKGVLKTLGTGARNLYVPAISKEAYIQKWTSDFLKEFFDGSLSKFISAFTGNANHLSQKDIEELQQLLSNYKD